MFELVFCYFAVPSAKAQIQQAWVAHYNNGVTNGQHQALKMALGADGNIYVCGFSQNFNSNSDYAVLKYTPAGNLIWVARYESSNAPQAKPAGFALDSGNNALLTGNAGTVKVDAIGAITWVAPYAGLGVAADTNADVFVTGFGTNFDIVKLSPAGQELWSQTYSDAGPVVGESVIVDHYGNAFVAGLDVYFVERSVSDQGLLGGKYSSDGTLLWRFSDTLGGGFEDVLKVSDCAVDSLGNYSVLFDGNNFQAYTVDRLNDSGQREWQISNPTGTLSVSYALALSPNGRIGVTGQFYDDAYGTYGITAEGACIWTNIFPSRVNDTTSIGKAIASGASGLFVTGFSSTQTTSNDIVTIAYDTNGKQLWLQRYDGPAHGDDEGNAICVDTNGNVYVAGYDTPIGGGTEMVLIKYSPVTVKHEANGDFQLEAQGSPSEPFDIQASTNLDTWLDLGDFAADTNGVLQFTDTNAGQFPTRFYLALPQ